MRRLDIRYPWLKILLFGCIGFAAILDLGGVTISEIGDSSTRKLSAPMQRHAKIPDRVLVGKKLIALTFDDGPSESTTPKLLKILQQRAVPATFFMLGSMARANPEIVKKIASEGHEPASHTMYHQNFAKISTAAIRSDINESNAVFQEILQHPISLTRTPYGVSTKEARDNIATPIILWSVDSLDWQYRDCDKIVSTVMEQKHDGAIILMHDIHATSVEAVPQVIDRLRDAGYEFVTVSELAKQRGKNLSSGSIYYNFRP